MTLCQLCLQTIIRKVVQGSIGELYLARYQVGKMRSLSCIASLLLLSSFLRG